VDEVLTGAAAAAADPSSAASPGPSRFVPTPGVSLSLANLFLVIFNSSDKTSLVSTGSS
jgi:hypothetical protein